VLLGHAAIAEVAVVSAPDERLGERAAAVVRTHAGAAVTLDDLRAHLAERGLAKQKWPESLYEVADFPRTPSGKVQKFRLRQQLRDGQL
jgi:acyl-CoA synthetase (AMP-forming)/AMP-acid ligase II